MNVGDLVEYVENNSGLDRPYPRGIVVEVPADLDGSSADQVRIVWYTSDNQGWWNTDKLEVISENR